jgi:hypothetical protein
MWEEMAMLRTYFKTLRQRPHRYFFFHEINSFFERKLEVTKTTLRPLLLDMTSKRKYKKRINLF